jgi:osmotically inducible lipoprotein OsmB
VLSHKDNIQPFVFNLQCAIKEKLMTTTMKRLTAAVLATTLVVALSGCSNWSKRDRNTAIGAGAGAIGGSVLTNGSGLGTVGGAAVGGIIGHQISK